MGSEEAPAAIGCEGPRTNSSTTTMVLDDVFFRWKLGDVATGLRTPAKGGGEDAPDPRCQPHEDRSPSRASIDEWCALKERSLMGESPSFVSARVFGAAPRQPGAISWS